MKEIHFPCEDADLKSLATEMKGLSRAGQPLDFQTDGHSFTYAITAPVSQKHDATVSVDTWLEEGHAVIPPHLYFLAHDIAERSDRLQKALTDIGFNVYVHPTEFWCSANIQVTSNNVRELLRTVSTKVLPILKAA